MYSSVPGEISVFVISQDKVSSNPPPLPSFVSQLLFLIRALFVSYAAFPAPSESCMYFCLGLLSSQGRTHVSGMLRQGNSLHDPRITPLKDIVKNYAALTG